MGSLDGSWQKCGDNQGSFGSQLRTRRIWFSQRVAHIHATVWKLQDEMQGVFFEFLEGTDSMLGILEVERVSFARGPSLFSSVIQTGGDILEQSTEGHIA